MTLRKLIEKLKPFDNDYEVEMEILTECGCLTVGSDIWTVELKKGKLVLYGQDC